MPELTPEDVAQYTSNRLADDAPETERLLSVGLAAARRFCGWNVNLVEDDEITMDGPGSTLLVLPTLRLVELTEVTDNGVELDVETDLYVSQRGLVRKRTGLHWSGYFGAITLKMTHGFDDAADFNAAVLSFVDRSSLAATGGRANAVGPFKFDVEAMASASAFSVVERSLLEQYRLESAP